MISCAIALIFAGGTALAEAPEQAAVEPYVPGELVVKLVEGTSPATVAGLASALGAVEIGELPGIGVRHWKLGKGLSVEKALELLARRPWKDAIAYAEPNYLYTIDELPNDPLRGELWGLHNVGQTGGTRGADIDALDAWTRTTGDPSVVVAVIDTGIDFGHPDLAARIDPRGKDFVNGDDDPSDDNGHGTHVSGTIGAAGNDGRGIVGVAWNVRILPLKALNAGGSGTATALTAAIQYAGSLGVPVISASWGGDRRSSAMQAAIEACGALFVAAAGNSGSTTRHYPAAYDLPNIVSVAATDDDDLLASFSNRSATWVDLGAPGVAVYSSVVGGGYGVKSGTSMAAPHVAGVAALVKSASPGSGPLDVKGALLAGVDPLPSLLGLTVTGGRLNAARTLGVTPAPPTDTTPPEPVVTLGATVVLTSSITLEWVAPVDDSGPAYLYDLRTSRTPIDGEAAFSVAKAAPGEPLPEAAGTVQTLTLPELDPGTYWVAMKVTDAAGNTSGLSNVVEVATAPGPHWETSPEVPAQQETRLAYTPDGRPSLAFDGSDGFVKLATWDALTSSWAIEPIGPGGRGIDLAYDPRDGFPSLSYATDVVEYAHWNGSAWQIETVETGTLNNPETSLAFDGDGRPSICYRVLRGKVKGLVLARWNGSAWTRKVVDAFPARYSSHTYDAAGNPVVAYSEDLDGDNTLDAVELARWDGSAWQREIVESGVTGFGVYVSLALDPAGNASVTHGNGTVRFVRKEGAVWVPEVVSATGSRSRLRYDAAGTPVVSLKSLSSEGRLARRDGGSWTDLLVIRGPVCSGCRTDVAIAPDGLPTPAYVLSPAGAVLARWVEE